ncbi:MAG: 2-hydroxy-3-oxopropionate reductase [SAR86 cluster bacterium]|uniref:2-hydroxy-3-oxopropionate reductase n=1 Tax=SAR86 cluster bacterium TaxID=2030880 RepID=A0A2A5C7I1_9GAMM|nr:MAG: 2-hydroxy-3-oxopropionate reductase [SAR86 cluster bacterium]
MTNKISPPALIGFVGLGNMGYPMAKCLVAAGYQLVVADLNTEAVEKFCTETGSSSAQNLQDLAAKSDVVITMLPEGNAVRQVLMSEDGIVSGLQQGTILIDMSSCSPVGTRKLAGELEELDFPLIDAPVSGGVYKAAEGGLSIMVGGEKAVVERCLPLLEVMGKPFLTGGPASGHAMKAMNNYLSAASLAIASEAVILGSKFGLNSEVMVDILNASTGRSNSTEHKFPTFILPGTFNSGFFIGLMAKDLRLARELAEAEGTSTDILKLVSTMWDKAEAELGFKADNTEVYKYLESQVKDGS